MDNIRLSDLSNCTKILFSIANEEHIKPIYIHMLLNAVFEKIGAINTSYTTEEAVKKVIEQDPFLPNKLTSGDIDKYNSNLLQSLIDEKLIKKNNNEYEITKKAWTIFLKIAQVKNSN